MFVSYFVSYGACIAVEGNEGLYNVVFELERNSKALRPPCAFAPVVSGQEAGLGGFWEKGGVQRAGPGRSGRRCLGWCSSLVGWDP